MQYYDNYVQRKRRRPDLSGARRELTQPAEGQAVEPETIQMPEVEVATNADVMAAAEDSQRERLKLAGVYGLIALCATIMAWVLGFDLQIWLEWFMGGFFIIFGSFKLIGYEMFVMMFPQYDPIGARYKLYTLAYPFIELFLGFLYVANLLPVFRDLVTLAIFGVGAWGVTKYVGRNQGEAIRCACLGNIIKLPLSTVTLIEDVLMAAMSVIMLISYFVF